MMYGITYGRMPSTYIGNAMLLGLNLPLIPRRIRVLQVPYTILSILILIVCLFGSYSVSNSIYDSIIAYAFGVVGSLIKKRGFEPAPLILASVLGPLTEIAFRSAFSDCFRRKLYGLH